MSSAGPVPTPSVRLGVGRPGARHARTADERYLLARRWTVGVLVTASVVLVGGLAVTVLLMWSAVSAFGASTADRSAGAALLDLGRAVLPSLLVGWCSALAALAALVRGDALGPRTTGTLAGVLGILAGGAVLAVAGSS